MNKNVIIAVVLAAIAGGGYYYYTGQQKAAMEQSVADKAAEAAKMAEEAAAKAAEEAAAMAEEEAAKAAEEAAAMAEEEAAKAAEEAAATAAEMSPADLLNPENFDLDKVTALLDGSSVDGATKTALQTALTAAGDNPDLLKTALDAIKAALGL